MNLPQQFGPYLLLERISVGGMAEVYKAKEYGVEDFERIVAVKRILPHVAEDEEFIAMFKDEAKIAVQLNHGNIAQIYNLGNEQDSFYIALEYINGRDLRAIFQKCQQAGRPMPVAQACYIIMKICEGLDYAHNKKDKYNRPLNIVHRDVSPPNILVSFEGEVKLIDFGVAKAAGRASRTQAGILKGKFGYMSPEQVRGMPLDRRSDVFSVGVVLFEILTNQRLFQADTDFATLEKVRAVEVPRPSSINPEIPKPLENIIYKALAREPEQRYQSSIELHDELQAFMFAQGMFYSRKDLAGWARENYAREIELEKEKANAQAGIRPNGAGQPRRRTLMMPPGAGRPPPPPPGGVRRNTGAPPPPPRQAGTGRPPPPRGAGAGGPPRPPEPPAGARGRKNVKRKTMVMTTARPNLPKPAGGGGPPKPRPRVEAGPPRSAGLPKPTSSPPPKPRPKPVAKSTASYVATPGGQAPSADFDWDDDELETRLFEGKEEEKSQGGAKRTTAPISSRPGPAERGGARVVGGGIKTPELGSDEDSEAPTRVDLGGPPANLPPKSVTVSPSLSNPAPAIRQSSPTVPVSPARSAVPPVAHQAPLAPPQVAVPPAPMPSAAQGMAAAAAAGPAPGVGHPHAPPQHMPAPSASVSANANPFAPAPMAGYGGQPAPAGMPPHGMPMPAPVGMDFDDRPPKSNAGLVVVIVLALLILFGAGLGGFYLLLSDKDGGSSSSGNGDAVASQEQGDNKGESTPADPPSAKRGVLTIEVVPVSAQVTVDGASVDGPSPFVKPLTAGKHKIAVSHPDFLPFDKEVEVTDAGLTLPVRLHHRAVSLLVETDPAGGKVSLFVDGTEASTASSGGKISVTRDPTKKYEVQASLKGHVTQRNALDFTGDKTQPVKIALVKDAVAMAPPPATDPQPANNGGGGSTTKSNGGGGGSKARRGGGGGGTKRKPKPAAKTATLKIGTNMGVAPASVYVDGKFVGKTPQGNVKVTPGRHTVKWQWDNGKKITQSVTVADGQTKLVKAG